MLSLWGAEGVGGQEDALQLKRPVIFGDSTVISLKTNSGLSANVGACAHTR